MQQSLHLSNACLIQKTQWTGKVNRDAPQLRMCQNCVIVSISISSSKFLTQ